VVSTESLTRNEVLALLEQSNAKVDALATENKLLREVLASLKDEIFGRKSERIDPNQLGLFGGSDPQAASSESDAEPEMVTVPEHRRRKRGHGRKPFPDDLPREVVEVDLDDDEKCCPDCGETLRQIGIDACERGHIVPARLVVIRYEKKKYACPAGHCVRTAEAPPGLIDRCKYEPSVYAHVAVAKYQDHVPLNRAAGILKRYGIDLPKQTMWDMLLRAHELFVRPILEQMRLELLCESILHGDETPAPVRVEGGKGITTGRVWAWHSLGAKKVVLAFTMTKERDGPVAFLGKWDGTLIADGASNFNEMVARNEITRAGCWAHARRKLKKALDRGSKQAIRLLVPVQRLFRLEKSVRKRAQERDLSDSDLAHLLRRVRARRSKKLVEKIYELADEIAIARSTLPRSIFGKAVSYIANQRGPLAAFLDDTRLPIHNNDCERTLRHVVIGRKNWLVFGSPRGGMVACDFYSLMLSCRAIGLDPEAYLADALTRINSTPVQDIASLTPWAWAQAHPKAVADPR